MAKKSTNNGSTNSNSLQTEEPSDMQNSETNKDDSIKRPTANTGRKTKSSTAKPKSGAARKKTSSASVDKNSSSTARKTSTRTKARQPEDKPASIPAKKSTASNKTVQSEQTIVDAIPAGKLGMNNLGESSKSQQPVNKDIGQSSQSPATGITAADSEDQQKQVYHEPDAPLAYKPPPVEEAPSINPPIPEESDAAEEILDEQEMHVDTEHDYEHPGPQYPAMYIVQITPELAPLAKVGGLADVVTGLSRELELRGNSVEIILPKYDCMRYDHIWGLCKTMDDLWVPWFGGHIHCTVWFGFVHGRKCFFIEPHSQDDFFNRGSIYGFDDDILRFAFFSRASIEFLWKAGKHPDIIHCHDWQTALVPVFLYEVYQHMGMTHPRVCYTIHNYKHQGTTGDFLLEATGLNRPEYYFHYDRLLDNNIPHALNLMKGGIVYSNFVTTVSPRYAGETKDGGQGFGLEATLHAHGYKYGGIVNGIDYDSWNPEIDPHIPNPYSINNIDEKYNNKRALRHRLLIADNEKPIIAFIGRLDPQKGLDLVRHALFYALNNAAQFILLGSSPDNDINNYFWELKRQLNDSPDCHIEVGFDEDLAHLIYAGSDMMIVPSLFEPCGLTQLIAMQYGTIPVVRSVGGLADTVHDKDNAHNKPLHERNGYVFSDYNNAGLESALSRAISCYYQYPEHFRELLKNSMRHDYSWRDPGQNYLNIYDYIKNK